MTERSHPDTDGLTAFSVSSVPKTLITSAADRLAELGGPPRPGLAGLVRAALAALAGLPVTDVISQARPKREHGDPIERIREGTGQ